LGSRTAVIAGIGLSDFPKTPHLDAIGHHGLAIRRALDDSGIAKHDIDGLMCVGTYGLDDAATMAEILGIDHRYIDGTDTGGAVFEYYVQHAAAAIEHGECETVLITYGSDFLSRMGRTLGTQLFGNSGNGRQRGALQFDMPYGSPLVSNYALSAMRHMHEFGTTSEALAQIAVDIRQNASLNPDAMYQTPITVDDVLGSRMISDPLHLLDCCIITDGGGAVLMTTGERAKDLRQAPVYVLGAASAQTHWSMSQMPSLTTTAAAITGPLAFAKAGVSPADVDTLQLYDSFTITVLLLLEDLGFCKKGEGGDLIKSGLLTTTGELPTNTDGGGLSSCHPGRRGIFLLIEAVRQLRGHAGAAQVPDCKIAVASGSGGNLSCMGTVILGKEGS
jgi:acetyl-CoA acetyltransferase